MLFFIWGVDLSGSTHRVRYLVRKSDTVGAGMMLLVIAISATTAVVVAVAVASQKE